MQFRLRPSHVAGKVPDSVPTDFCRNPEECKQMPCVKYLYLAKEIKPVAHDHAERLSVHKNPDREPVFQYHFPNE